MWFRIAHVPFHMTFDPLVFRWPFFPDWKLELKIPFHKPNSPHARPLPQAPSSSKVQQCQADFNRTRKQARSAGTEQRGFVLQQFYS